ncbi:MULTISPECIES: LysR family transcriptional regulator [Pseudoxanthomonas]|uniref:DNA-binding transcriptional LysR family regulator n=1 Tax=Pseudoxanthomonas winnipegensis TaxID=2480810 RepID=A0AAW8GAC4_9GAMM|nr:MULTISPECIES: LysR family transcriptional regulator [Pseudoxanthomonas]MDQ1119297.1 DNA-binding transcriptional LysR family regulator [Pseudoxanthomonas winnipegensis]MDQ1132492.1 DNA-binding transcriptional LysR family regulator [Pseudoxanthomonas winnipegensis]MDR6137499.1 DNA-binding transcriptional LysR family regulator [Pseudoxanthomonas sp. SORGH_AS_0997]
MDRLEAMRVFASVVEASSFTKAAAALRISKTSATQLVQQLEAHLQVKLLNRTTRRVSPTADGLTYYAQVVRVLADIEDAEDSLAAAATAPRGRLRVDVPSPWARFVLLPALPDFLARYPDIRFDIGVSDRAVDLIGEQVDCVVRAGVITDPSLVARHVGQLEIGLYAAPSYLARHGTPTHPDALTQAAHRVVGFRSPRTGKVLELVLHKGDEHLVPRIRPAVTLDDGNACLAAGTAGLGLLCLPHYMTREALASGALVRLLDDWRLEPMPLSIAYRANRHPNRKLRAFIDWVVELVDARDASVVLPG